MQGDLNFLDDALSTVKITAIRRQKRRKNRLDVYLDGELGLCVADEVALRNDLHVDRSITAAEIAALEADDAAWRAREAALRLLAHRSRSEGELRQRLRMREHEPAAIDAALDALRRAGLVDDAAFARAFVSERLSVRPAGRARLLSELRRRGVPPDEAQAALDEAVGAQPTGEEDLARRAAAKFRPRAGEEPARARRRLLGYLSRRGFSADAVRTVVRETLP